MIVTLMCANFIIGNIYVNGTPSVKVVQYHRDGSSVFPCRWFASVGIYIVSKTVEEFRSIMYKTAAKLPEFPVVMNMKGVGPSLGPQLMAEIGDVLRFTQALTAFAGVDPGVNESGSYA